MGANVIRWLAAGVPSRAWSGDTGRLFGVGCAAAPRATGGVPSDVGGAAGRLPPAQPAVARAAAHTNVQNTARPRRTGPPLIRPCAAA